MMNRFLLTPALLLLLVLFTSNVHAHSPLAASFPKNGESLDASPTAMTFSFKKKVKLVQVRIRSHQVDEKIKPESMTELVEHSVPLPKLSAGEYTAAWRALGADGHLMKGKISFTISP